MKLTHNKKTGKVSLELRENNDLSDKDRLEAICISESWDIEDVEILDVSEEDVVSASKATDIEMRSGGFIFTYSCTEQERLQKIQIQYAHAKDKLQAVKNKYPEVVDLLVELDIIPKEL